ncbi:hypothetical protein LTR62_004647 [Meristemomyces frigidus]|uniref:Vacuolar ATPase assembly protein VMA22 n=1 Tax=Meristemomyces frigidus TaxID=1508187 RepID=A0AAN7TEI0_9PEZI|nr:hypothetical protein LTR62_004647 [Meristemomyces frigidus]
MYTSPQDIASLDESQSILMERPPELHVLLDRLDDLWSRYLTLTDAYQQAQADMARLLSKGHFSLTQANCRSASRVRHGQDFYDQRMKASRLATIARGPDPTPFTTFVSIRESESAVTAKPFVENKASNEPKQQPSPPSTPGPNVHEPQPAEAEQADEDDSTENMPIEDSNTRVCNPLHWFGILVPQELRSAQTSFSAATTGPLVTACNAASGMRELELEIRRARKAIDKYDKAAAKSGV